MASVLDKIELITSKISKTGGHSYSRFGSVDRQYAEMGVFLRS
jgi:hypothetical protein